MGGANGAWVQTPTPLAFFLQNKFSEVNTTVRIARSLKALVSEGDKNFFEDKIIMADSSILMYLLSRLLLAIRMRYFGNPNSVVVN